MTSPEVLSNLAAHIPGDRRHALATGSAMPERVRGAGLLADIAGFTPLTEALANELGSQRGAEELTAYLNRVFDALIGELERFGGHVIYFSGDALTCWIDADDGSRATACAIAMQQAMGGLAHVITPAGSRIRLAMKVIVAVGSAMRFVVGAPDIQRIDVLAGGLVDELAAAEHAARRTEVMLDRSALESLAERVEISELRADESSGRSFAVVQRMSIPVGEHREVHEEALPEDVVKQWLQPAIFERLRTGHGEFLAELRPAYPMFVRFGGIDYDVDEAAPNKLDEFVRRVQSILQSYGGTLLHLTLGDKGAYLSIVFGPPLAHEDDATRAVAAAIEVRDLASTTAATDIQIAITYGRLRSGIYGHRRRQTFTCLGDAVNLSARLMSEAPPGAIYVSDPVPRLAGDQFAWEPLPPFKVKGKSESVSAFSLKGSMQRSIRSASGDEAPLVGRKAELRTLLDKLDQAIAGHCRLVGLAGEAGMGKSRLAAELVQLAKHMNIVVAQGECQAYGTNASYLVWRSIWSTLLNRDESLPISEQIDALENTLASIDETLVARAPLLRELLDLSIPDNELTASFDAKLRKTSLEALLIECLRSRAAQAPLVIVMEDCHWIDSLSRDLLQIFARTMTTFPVLFVLAYRPSSAASGGLGIDALPNFNKITLGELVGDEAEQMIRMNLRPIMAGGDAPKALVDLIAKRAQGNPFYIEEIAHFIDSQRIDPRDESALKRLDLPESLHSLILSRVDMLAESPRETLKVVSVVGRVFLAATLSGVYPTLGLAEDVADQLTTLVRSELVQPEQQLEQAYAFKHVMTQEVAYESLPFSFRAELHERAGKYIETHESEEIDRHLDLLAHHYWNSANRAKKREYLRRAGEAAQATYANPAAIDYFERLVALLDGSERVAVLLKLGKVHELVGNWRRAEEVHQQAYAFADELKDDHSRAWCETGLAEIARKQGRYEAASELLGRARQRFQSLREEAGAGRVLHLDATIAAQRGDYDTAIARYAESLAIRERLGDKASMGAILSNLGVISEYRGDYVASHEFHERALALRTDIGDRWAIGVSMNNLGMTALLQQRYEDAREWFTKSMQLCRKVGDNWMVAICDNNLGNAMRGLGEHVSARYHYAESLRACRDYDDRWALAFLLEDIGLLEAASGDARSALELVGAADSCREAIGAARAPSRTADIDAALASAVAGIAEEEQLSCRSRGRSRDFSDAIDHALAICDVTKENATAHA